MGYSMSAWIAQQLLIRHPDLVHIAIPTEDVEARLNNPNIPQMEKLAQIKAAVATGTMLEDYKISMQTIARQNRARTVLWSSDESNFANPKTIQAPVLITDGRSDIIDLPRNSPTS